MCTTYKRQLKGKTKVNNRCVMSVKCLDVCLCNRIYKQIFIVFNFAKFITFIPVDIFSVSCYCISMLSQMKDLDRIEIENVVWSNKMLGRENFIHFSTFLVSLKVFERFTIIIPASFLLKHHDMHLLLEISFFTTLHFIILLILMIRNNKNNKVKQLKTLTRTSQWVIQGGNFI
jgi:hypothetical protein